MSQHVTWDRIENDKLTSVRIFLGNTWAYRIIRYAIAGVFLWSGITKIMDPESFVVIIDAFGIIPEAWNMTMAILLSGLEIIGGIGLMADLHGSLSGICGLLLIFMAILGYGIWLGLDIDCGCFGPEDPEANAFHGLRAALYRDFILLGSVIYLYLWRFFNRKNHFATNY